MALGRTLMAALVAALPAGGAPLRLRIASYNIHHGAGSDGRLDLARIGAVVLAADPDLVALQEVERGTTRTGRADQPAELARQTGRVGLFGRAIDFAGGGYGNAILSRFAPADTMVTPLPVYGEPRCCLRTTVSVPGLDRPLAFLATHLDFEDGAAGNTSREHQVDAILAQAAALPADGVAVLAGDFNCEPGSTPLARLLAAGWIEVTAANGPTCPADQPAAKIDHIFVRPGAYRVRVVSCAVIDERVASDHRPVVAEIELLPAEPGRSRAWSLLG